MSLKHSWVGFAVLAVAIGCGGGGDGDGSGSGGSGNTGNDGSGNTGNDGSGNTGNDSNGGTGNTGNQNSGGNSNNGGSGNPGDGEAFEVVHQINKTFWHGGFKVDIGDATFAGTAEDALGHQEITVTVEATFTNEGEDTDRFGSHISLVDPNNSRGPNFDTDIPNTPGGGSLSSDIIFTIDENEEFDFNGAYLLLGSGEEQQARVPLGPNGGELVALEPKELDITGMVSTSLLDVKFTSAALRADDPVNHREIDAGKLGLTLNFEVTSRKTGNWSITAAMFSLTLPDNSTIAPAGSLFAPIAGSEAGLTTGDMYVRFEVEEPETGAYVLHFIPSSLWLEDGDATEMTMNFEIE
jgi:hypothetical protein